MAKREESRNYEDIGLSDSACVQEAHRLRHELTGSTEFAFEIGKIAFSENVLDKKEKTKKLLREKEKSIHGSFAQFAWDCFARHCLCDWGDVSPEQKNANHQAVKTGGQLFSTYTHAGHPALCILTEADRSETIVGLAEEFKEG